MCRRGGNPVPVLHTRDVDKMALDAHIDHVMTVSWGIWGNASCAVIGCRCQGRGERRRFCCSAPSTLDSQHPLAPATSPAPPVRSRGEWFKKATCLARSMPPSTWHLAKADGIAVRSPSRDDAPWWWPQRSGERCGCKACTGVGKEVSVSVSMMATSLAMSGYIRAVCLALPRPKTSLCIVMGEDRGLWRSSELVWLSIICNTLPSDRLTDQSSPYQHSLSPITLTIPHLHHSAGWLVPPSGNPLELLSSGQQMLSCNACPGQHIYYDVLLVPAPPVVVTELCRWCV
jgi:hypothetical protein